MMKHRPAHLAAAAFLAIATSSCQPHDPFCFSHPHGMVKVEYDWSQAPDAEGIRSTRVHFYRAEDGTKVTTANFSGMKGGMLYLGEGEYDVVSYNSDTDRIFWKGEEMLNTLEAYTRNASLTEDLQGFSYENIPGLVLTPNRIWSARKDRIYVSRNDTTVITLEPLKATYEVIWEVNGIKGAKRVKACAVSLSGVGGSLMLDDWRTERNESLMSGTGRRSESKGKTQDGEEIGGFRGEFEAFGCNFLDDCRHEFTIYCWANGGNIKASYDVTGQFHVVEEDRKIYIRIDADFEIPTGGSSESSGGFDPDVGQWGVKYEDIIL